MGLQNDLKRLEVQSFILGGVDHMFVIFQLFDSMKR